MVELIDSSVQCRPNLEGFNSMVPTFGIRVLKVTLSFQLLRPTPIPCHHVLIKSKQLSGSTRFAGVDRVIKQAGGRVMESKDHHQPPPCANPESKARHCSANATINCHLNYEC
ncbi:hypothetical protein SDJN02_15293, partial [Cucurbita argyrosperma subsp. argyrosperma]